MAGLRENDMASGLLWEIDPESPSALPVRKDNNGTQTVVRRAPSWSCMSLVGHIYQAEGDRASIGRGCCSPANPDGQTLRPNPDGWGPLMIMYKDFPPILRLEAKAYIRKVRISQARLPNQEDEHSFAEWGSHPAAQHIESFRRFPELGTPIDSGHKAANPFKRFLEADEEAPNSITSDENFAGKASST